MKPKKIHYCWFGSGEKPKPAQKCIARLENRVVEGVNSVFNNK